MDPVAVNRAVGMWNWCRERGFNIRDLAMQFALGAPIKGNGIVLTGPASPQEFDEAYLSAIKEVSDSVWTEFDAEFGVRN